jgi:hypothetical protein
MINFEENKNILKTIFNSIHLYYRQQISKAMSKALFAYYCTYQIIIKFSNLWEEFNLQ